MLSCEDAVRSERRAKPILFDEVGRYGENKWWVTSGCRCSVEGGGVCAVELGVEVPTAGSVSARA